jgi:two-component system, sporulation sensor kinase D
LPVLKKEPLAVVLDEAINYLQSRTPSRINFVIDVDREIMVPLNVPLFEWVVENLVRNAADAMEAEGTISIKANDQQQFVYIDISDTGKGIARNKFKTVFEPGFTTKKRGWGLGLSLAKRIIENYHEGKIFVKASDPGKGTTFRIVLNKKL